VDYALRMSLAVLIPAFNEAEQLPGTLAGIATALPGARVVVVENGCTDATPDLARSLGAEVISQPGRGYTVTIAAGYRHCIACGVTRVVQMDADGQHPPADAPALLAALDGADLVTGSRDGTGSPGTAARRAANAILASAVRATTGAPLRDVLSGYWALSRPCLELFAHCFPLPGGAADANVRVFALNQGLRVREVPVYMPVRTTGDSMHSGVQGLRGFVASVRSLAVQL
jgi:glycosyltransferase involved in cell wall biosynthesis